MYYVGSHNCIEGHPVDYKVAKHLYNVQKGCKARGRKDVDGTVIEMRLTFEEWADIWMESGKWAQRGNRKGQYCMARHGDRGHYEKGNVSIILCDENKSYAHKGVPKSAEHREKIRQANTGKVCSEVTKAKLSAMNKGKPMKRVQCGTCGFETSPQNMSRHIKARHG